MLSASQLHRFVQHINRQASRVSSEAINKLFYVFLQNTWVLRRVFQPEVTPPGGVQKNPNDFHDYQKYEVVEFETQKSAGPINVILLQDVEGSFLK